MKNILLIILFALFVFPAKADSISLANLAKDSRGKVLFIRHALAPGSGDPSNFTLGDCTTQRNLNDDGRKQSRGIGDNLRKAGVKVGLVYSSQWCRCIETAKHMNVGAVKTFEGLNSFYDLTDKEGEWIGKLKKFIRSLDQNGDLVIMVTHFVTISAMTGEGVDSGGGVVMSLKDQSVKNVSDLN
ncbi:MAG: histidine phosphatase family protein [Rhodospirillales bacterium]|jgi:phosphohistidine phosphatase SixA